MKVKKAIIYLILALSSLIAGIYSPSIFNDLTKKGFLETSMLSLLNNVYESSQKTIDETKISSVDLSLEKVSIIKKGDIYNATIKISNTGSFVKDLKVIAGNDLNNDFIFLRNGENGLTLNKDEIFLTRDYPLSIDERFSGTQMNFYIRVLNDDVYEKVPENNNYKIRIDQFNPTLEDFYISKIANDKSVSFEYKLNDFIISEKNIEILISNRLTFDTSSTKYKEAYSNGKIYSYNEIPLSESVYKSGNFKTIKASNEIPINLKVYEDPFAKDLSKFYIILKVNFDDSVSTRYKLSNIIEVGPQISLNKESFRNLFMERTGNVPDLYTDATFVTRLDALKTIFDYYDIDILNKQVKKNIFKDINTENDYYQYVQSLSRFPFSSGLSEYFAQNEPANKEFVIQLFNAIVSNN